MYSSRSLARCPRNLATSTWTRSVNNNGPRRHKAGRSSLPPIAIIRRTGQLAASDVFSADGEQGEPRLTTELAATRAQPRCELF
ncbi:hypothetical protein MTO96_033903 [Rhipicephalus appendiculatus]